MGQDSRNVRRKRRQKRTISLTRRELIAAQKARLHTHLILLMVVAQAGGEVTISKGTYQTILQGFQSMQWVVEPQPSGEMVVKVVIQAEEPTAVEPVDVLPSGATIGYVGAVDADAIPQVG